jgi:hypothetical protein
VRLNSKQSKLKIGSHFAVLPKSDVLIQNNHSYEFGHTSKSGVDVQQTGLRPKSILCLFVVLICPCLVKLFLVETTWLNAKMQLTKSE